MNGNFIISSSPTLDTTRVAKNLKACFPTDSGFYEYLHRHLEQTGNVLNIADSVNNSKSFLLNNKGREEDICTATEKMVTASNASFFIDLGPYPDPGSDGLKLENGMIVGVQDEADGPNPILPCQTLLSQVFKGITNAHSISPKTTVLVSSSTLERKPEKSLIVDECGNDFSFEADVEPVLLGNVPGQRRHIISSIKICASSSDRAHELRKLLQPFLRPIIVAVQVALAPPAISTKNLPWRSIYAIGTGLLEWKECQSQLLENEYLAFFDGEDQIATLGTDSTGASKHVSDPLGLLEILLAYCSRGEPVEEPSCWDRDTALKWCSWITCSPNKHLQFNIWQVAIVCEHMGEVSNRPETLSDLAIKSRQLTYLLGTRYMDDCGLSASIARASSETMRVASAILRMQPVELQRKQFTPLIIGPVSPDSFDHLGPSYFGAQKLQSPTCTSDGIPVGKGRGIKLSKCLETITVRKKFRRIMATVEKGVVLISQNSTITDFKSAVSHISAVEASVSPVTVRTEFEHVSREQVVRTDNWRVASRTVVNQILKGLLNTDASVWLIQRMRNGDVAVSEKSRNASYLIGSNCLYTPTGILIEASVDPGVMKRLPTYFANNRMWIDIDDKGDLRRVSRKTRAVLRVERHKFSGNTDDLWECSVRGEYGLSA